MNRWNYRSLLLLSLAVLSGACAPAERLQSSMSFEEFSEAFTRAQSLAADDPSGVIELQALSPVTSVFQQGRWDPQTWTASEPKLGSLHFMIGDLEAAPTETEMQMFYGMTRWALGNGFNLRMDPAATGSDLRGSITHPDLSVLIWSSHGSRDGRVWDAKKVAVAQDAFSKDASSLLKYYVFSNCFSNMTVDRYSLVEGAGRTYWEGTTTSSDLKAFVYSPEFNERLRKAGVPVR
jgi:hypothetical protein